jgi:hypothetical protein
MPLLSLSAQDAAPIIDLVLLVVLFTAVGLVFRRLFGLYRARTSQKLPVDEELASADPDREGLVRLERSKSDLSKVHKIDFYLYFPNDAAAKQAARQIEAQDFEVKVRRMGRKAEWLCFAQKSMMPDYDTLVAIRKTFGPLANSLEGIYDGWGTRIVK